MSFAEIMLRPIQQAPRVLDLALMLPRRPALDQLPAESTHLYII